jgi:hypothetical protein
MFFRKLKKKLLLFEENALAYYEYLLILIAGRTRGQKVLKPFMALNLEFLMFVDKAGAYLTLFAAL